MNTVPATYQLVWHGKGVGLAREGGWAGAGRGLGWRGKGVELARVGG